jgi:sterol desaturase/sphingolipid hydroxylase (fatty acid hydroxylase superfamily)
MKISDFFINSSNLPEVTIYNFFNSLKNFIFGHGRLNLGPLTAFFLIAAVFYLFSNKHAGKKNLTNIFKFVFPKKIYSHPSTKIDLKVFLVRMIFDPAKLVTFSFFAYTLAIMVSGYLKNILPSFAGIIETNKINLFLISLLGFLLYDFSLYFLHRLFHVIPFLWPFHSVHHSAEVLNPFVASRDHFIWNIFENNIAYVFLGLGQGVVVWAFDSNLSPVQIFNFTLGLFLFNYIVTNLHHSHIWISFGSLDRIFLSPALHQIHHSVDRKHRNKNFGLLLSIWDQMFGSIYVPKEKEQLTYGIDKGVKNPHDTLCKFYFLPFKESWLVLRKKFQDLFKMPTSKSPTPANAHKKENTGGFHQAYKLK